MSPRRELVVDLIVLLAGAGLVLLAGTQVWIEGLEGNGAQPNPAMNADAAGVSGGTVSPGSRALGLLGLAGVVAVPATGGWLRRVVGLLLTAAGLGVVLLGVSAGETVWPWLSVLGGILISLSGLATVWRGPSWSMMGSRYEAPSRADSRDDAWSALDRGEDPTA